MDISVAGNCGGQSVCQGESPLTTHAQEGTGCPSFLAYEGVTRCNANHTLLANALNNSAIIW